MLPRLKVLFLCTGNACRSQMAEAWARALHGDRIEAYSAGTHPGPIDPRAIAVMREVGIDMSAHRPKSVEDLGGVALDTVVTVCDRAGERCPVFPAPVRRVHAGFDDPPRLATDAATEEERLAHYRRVRDEIRAFVERLPASLSAGATDPSLEPARADDLPEVTRLVREADLPTAGIDDAFPGGYSVLRRGRAIVGVAGLERHGDVGLLRSVAVTDSERGKGLGRRLVEERLGAARTLGLRAVYLLTTTAADFFRGLGFVETARDSVPEALQASPEFAAVCPSTAACMVKEVP